MNALPRGELAGFVLACAALGASARFGLGGDAAKLLHAIAGLKLLCSGCCSSLFVRQAGLPWMAAHSFRRCARPDAWRATRSPANARYRATARRKRRQLSAAATREKWRKRWL